MATQELPQSVPQYPEMIFEAISALNEATGSKKSTISNYIESTYGDLPPGHTELLTQHLDKLKESRELILVNNKYMRPNPDAPPKRGRGRPPKPKSAAAMALAASSVGPPRGRGRPPKNRDESGRPRGGPKKVKGGYDEEGDLDEVVPAGGGAGLDVTGSPRPRGRPPKNRDESGGGGGGAVAVAVAEKRKVSEPSGRPRGRPKKVKAVDGEEEGDLDEVVPAGGGAGLNVTGSPRPRGRPSKVKTPFGDVGF